MTFQSASMRQAFPTDIPLVGDEDFRWTDAPALLNISTHRFRMRLKQGDRPPFEQNGRFRLYRPAAVRKWRVDVERSPAAVLAPRRGRPPVVVRL
jgi:hypothetical protein